MMKNALFAILAVSAIPFTVPVSAQAPGEDAETDPRNRDIEVRENPDGTVTVRIKTEPDPPFGMTDWMDVIQRPETSFDEEGQPTEAGLNYCTAERVQHELDVIEFYFAEFIATRVPEGFSHVVAESLLAYFSQGPWFSCWRPTFAYRMHVYNRYRVCWRTTLEYAFAMTPITYAYGHDDVVLDPRQTDWIGRPYYAGSVQVFPAWSDGYDASDLFDGDPRISRAVESEVVQNAVEQFPTETCAAKLACIQAIWRRTPATCGR